MNHILTRMADKLGETVAALRAKVAAVVPEGTSAYRADYIHVSVPAPDLARAADQLAEARRTIEQGIEREQKLRDRISRLESSNGHLMVDRDRGIRAAGERADGARLVALDMVNALREHGIDPGADIETLITDAARHYYDTMGHYERENQRLDAFRCAMVGLIQQCQTQAANGKGLTPELVGKLGRQINRANNKALGR